MHFRLFFLFLATILLAACNEEESPAAKTPAAAAPAPSAAKLELQIAELRYEFADGRHRYLHTRRYVESAGTGVTLKGGKVCFENGKTCLSASVNYRIEGGGTLEQPDHHVATRKDADVITIEYWGTDDAGNNVRVRRVLRVRGPEVEIE